MNKRRALLASLFAVAALPRLPGAAATARLPGAELSDRWRSFVAEGADLDFDTTPLQKPHEAWRAELPADSYAVLFEEDTEERYTSPLNLEKRPGVYVCRACRLPLFTSEMKYDSGTGWPSFFTCIAGHLATKADYRIFIPRTEYHCVRCGGHQGHVFDDGPEPTGERWCNNGLALAFVPLKA